MVPVRHPRSATERPRILDARAGVLRVRTTFLLRLADPLSVPIWPGGAVTREDVLASTGPVPTSGQCPDHRGTIWEFDPLARTPCRPCDVTRIRSFLERGIPEPDPHPIAVDVGYGFYVPDWLIVDGNHRLAAAALGGAPWLNVEVVGDWDRGVDLLVAERDPDGIFL